jgi:competence protein CoiA
MKFALLNDIRCEASPNLSGRCPACNAVLIAKCGTKRIWHWSHRGHRNCDPWWEPETEWHRLWKNLFPVEWQEIHHLDEQGERHIADIKTEHDLVIEVQHSAISDAEMNAREAHYQQMVWVVDATRLKRDLPRFIKGASAHLRRIGKGYFITRVPEECFPTRWLSRSVPVIFDLEALGGFLDGKPAENSRLWCLLPGRVHGYAVAAAVSRQQFAEVARQRAMIFPSEEIMKALREVMSVPRSANPPTLPFPPRWPRRRRYARF